MPNSILSLLEGPSVAPPETKQPNAILALLNPAEAYVPRAIEQSKEQGRSWEQTAEAIKESGGNPDDYAGGKTAINLAAARRRAGIRGESVSQVFRRKYMPFGDVVGTNFLPDLPDVSVGGAKLFGGRVVGNKEYADAVSRMKVGQETDDDIEAVAQYEASKGIDKQTQKNITLLGSHFAGKLALEFGNLGKLGAEMQVGGAALGKLAPRMMAGFPARAAAGAVPAIPATGVAAAARGLPALAARTGVSPGFWLPMMQERNMQEGRDPNSLKGLPTTFGYAMANLAVLGRLQSGLTGAPIKEMWKKGLLGTVELQGVDAAAGLMDQVLPKAYQIKPDDERWGTVGSWLRAAKPRLSKDGITLTGDKGAAEDALDHATIQFLSFSGFAFLHGRTPKEVDTLGKSYANTIAELRSSGMTRQDAGAKVKSLHDALETQLHAEPYTTREKAFEVLDKASDVTTKPYAMKLAEVFEPATKPVEPPKIEPAAAATEPTKPEPTVKKPTRVVPNPEPGETAESYAKKLEGHGFTPREAKVLLEAWGHTGPAPARVNKTKLAPEVPASVKKPEPVKNETEPFKEGETVYRHGSEVKITKVTPAGVVHYEGPGHSGAMPMSSALVNITRQKPASAPESTAPAPAPKVEPTHNPPPEVLEAGRRVMAKPSEEEASSFMDTVEKLPKDQVINLAASLMPHMPTPRHKAGAVKMLQTHFEKTLAAAATPPKVSDIPTVPAKPPEAPRASPVDLPATPPPPTTPPVELATRITSEAARRGYSGTDVAKFVQQAEALRKQTGMSEAEIMAEFEKQFPDNTISAAERRKKMRERLALSGAELSPEKMVEARDNATVERFDSQVDAANLPADVSKAHKERFVSFVSKLPEAARRLVSENLKGVSAHATLRDLSLVIQKRIIGEAKVKGYNVSTEAAILKEIEDGTTVTPGSFHPDGTLYIDGGGKSNVKDLGRYALPETVTAEGVLAHEMGHVVDGKPGKRFSKEADWIAAFKSEIDVKHGEVPALSEYAQTMPSEGFAEFNRLVHESDVPHSTIVREFPTASAFFKAKGLWPEVERAKKNNSGVVPISDQFNKRVVVGDGHADAIDTTNPLGGGKPAEPQSAKPVGVKELEADPSADRTTLNAMAAAAKDPLIKDALESVSNNIPEPGTDAGMVQGGRYGGGEGNARRMATINELTNLYESGPVKGRPEIADAIREFGGKIPEDVTKVAAAATTVESAVREAFGDSVRKNGDIYEARAGEGRTVTVTDQKDGSVYLEFGWGGSAVKVPKEMSQGSMTLAKNLKRLATSLAKNKIPIEYDAEARRHELYSRVLESEGYTLTKKVEGEKGGTDTYFYSIAEKPAAAATPEAALNRAFDNIDHSEGDWRGRDERYLNRLRDSVESEIGRKLQDNEWAQLYDKARHPKKPEDAQGWGSVFNFDPEPGSPDAVKSAPKPQSMRAAALKGTATGRNAALRKKLLEAPLTPEEQKIEDAKRLAREQPGETDPEKLGTGAVNRPDSFSLEGIKDRVNESKLLSVPQRDYLTQLLDGKSMKEAGEIYGVSAQSVSEAAQRGAKKLGFTDLADMLNRVRGGDAMGKAGRSKTAEGIEDFKEADPQTEQERQASRRMREEGEHGVGGMFSIGGNIRIGFLEGLFGKAGEPGKGLGSRLRRLVFGDMPKEVRTAKNDEIDHRIATAVYDVANAERDLRKAVREMEGPDGSRASLDNLPPEAIRKLDDILRLPAEEIVAAAATGGFTPKVGEVLRTMRLHVNRLSTELVDVGAIDSKLVSFVKENVGYLTRQYEVFTNPKWMEKVEPEVVNRFKSWLTAELASERGTAPTAEEVEAITKSLLMDGTAAENPIAFISKSKLGAKDLSILKHRKNIPDELRALWGEFRDPIVNYANSVGKMTNMVANHQFLKRVMKEGLGKILFRQPTGEHVVKLTDPGNESMRPVDGLYTTPEIKRAFEAEFKKADLPGYLQAYMKALATAKMSKVIFSHTGQMRNFLSNVMLAVRNGYWRVGQLPQAMKDVASDSAESRARWRRLVELGVVGEELNYRDFADTVKDATTSRSAFDRTSGTAEGMFGSMLKSAKGLAEKMYRYGDSFWKVYAFENEMSRYKKAHPELTQDQLERHVADIVRNTMPTYSKVPEGVKNLRRLPFIAPFVSFQAEVIRTTYNSMRLAFRELADSKTAAIGATRLAGLVAAAAIPSAIAMWLRGIQGIDADKEKKIRRFLPEYQKESQLYFVGSDKDGKPQYVDASRFDPHAYIGDAVLAAVRHRDDPDKGYKDVLNELAKPFVSEELLVRPILDVARNKKEPGGQVYNPEDSTRSQAGDIADRLAEPFKPGGWGPAKRLVMGLTGKTDQKTGRGVSEADAIRENASGVRFETLRVEETLAGLAHGFNQKTESAARMTNELIRAKGAVTEQEMAAAATRTADGRKRAFEDFAKDVEAALETGVPREKVIKILKDAGVSQVEIAHILRGTIPPYRPEVKGTLQERQRAVQFRRGIQTPTETPEGKVVP